jgi:UDP-N-acetylglucosamine 2-epimerase (non-hydrolysing)
MFKFIICYGTRPELIKLAPLIWEIKKSGLSDQMIVVNTNQHIHTMFEEELNIKPDYQLGVFYENQSIAQLTSKIHAKLDELVQQLNKTFSVKAIIAQGDTMTTLCTAQVSFFNRIPFYHIEAGLRSGNIHSPFPEEYNRKSISMMTALHFVPSEIEKENLINEGVDSTKIKVVGNTVYDVLNHYYNVPIETDRNTVLISIHRKANQNENLNILLNQILELAEENPQLEFIWLLHPSPYITNTVQENGSSISIRPNLSYTEMIDLYKKCKLVITDSGGIMEESAFLGIPRIIARTDNERKGLLDQADTFIYNPKNQNLKQLFDKALTTKGIRNFVYGTGNSSEQIVNALIDELK